MRPHEEQQAELASHPVSGLSCVIYKGSGWGNPSPPGMQFWLGVMRKATGLRASPGRSQETAQSRGRWEGQNALPGPLGGGTVRAPDGLSGSFPARERPNFESQSPEDFHLR